MKFGGLLVYRRPCTFSSVQSKSTGAFGWQSAAWYDHITVIIYTNRLSDTQTVGCGDSAFYNNRFFSVEETSVITGSLTGHRAAVYTIYYAACCYIDSVVDLCITDLDNLTDDSYEPRASVSKPQVIPLGGRLDIHCRVPNGRPTPSQRYANQSISHQTSKK